MSIPEDDDLDLDDEDDIADDEIDDEEDDDEDFYDDSDEDDDEDDDGGPSAKAVRQELERRGYTEIDFEVIEARANRMMEEMHIREKLGRFKFDFSHIVSPKKVHS